MNVISNSIKYTPEGGDITINISEEGYDMEKNVSYYRFIIEDTGIGMSEEYLPHIFEEFTREHTSTESKVVGTGLGLPIVKSLVELMEGSIEVESKIGEGTKTTIILPFTLADRSQMVSEQKQQENTKLLKFLRGKRVLLAEDNELNAEIAITILEEDGLVVGWAKDGIKCLEMLQKMPENYYDVILMDIQMPNMDGYQTTREIRNLTNKRAEIPIVAMTANAFDEDKKKAYDVGMDGYISKPIDSKEVFATLEEILLTKSEKL